MLLSSNGWYLPSSQAWTAGYVFNLFAVFEWTLINSGFLSRLDLKHSLKGFLIRFRFHSEQIGIIADKLKMFPSLADRKDHIRTSSECIVIEALTLKKI